MIDNVMSRLSSMSDLTGLFASYKYIRLGRLVEEGFQQADVKLLSVAHMTAK